MIVQNYKIYINFKNYIDKYKNYDYHTTTTCTCRVNNTTAASKLSSGAARRAAHSIAMGFPHFYTPSNPTTRSKRLPCQPRLGKTEKGAKHLLKLKEIRLRVGLTQVQLAEIVGVSQANVSAWELGQSDPSTDTVRKIAAALHCTTDELLGVEQGA